MCSCFGRRIWPMKANNQLLDRDATFKYFPSGFPGGGGVPPDALNATAGTKSLGPMQGLSALKVGTCDRITDEVGGVNVWRPRHGGYGA